MINSNTDLNDLVTPYKRYSWTTDAPVNAPFNYGMMNIIEYISGSVIMQFVTFQGYNIPKISYRMREYGTWGAWKEISVDIPSFYKNYNDLNSLVEGILTSVGVIFRYAHISSFDSIDSVLGNYCIGIGAPPQSWGSPISYGTMISLKSADTYTHQFVFPHKEYMTEGIKYRMHNGTNWGVWKTIQLT